MGAYLTVKVPFDLITELLQGEMKDFFLPVSTRDAKRSPALRNHRRSDAQSSRK